MLNRLLTLLFLACAVAGGAPPAHAHAVLLETDPADRAVLDASPPEIRLRFDEPVHPVAVRLLDTARRADLPAPAVHAQDQDVLVRPAAALAGGVYLLSWRVVSADSHPVAGTLLFAVGAPPAAWMSGDADGDTGTSPLAASNGPPPLALWVRAAHLLTLLWAAGAAAFAALVTPRGARQWSAAPGLVWWPAAAAALTALLGTGLHGAYLLDAAGPGAIFMSAAWQAGIAARGAGTAVTLVGLAAAALSAARPPGIASRANLLAGAGLALAGVIIGSHAMTTAPRLLAPGLWLAHLLGAAFWIGSLRPLLRVLRAAAPGATVARFSALALWAVPILILAGGTMAVLQGVRPDTLLETGYGRILLIKVALVAMLLALAARNRWRLAPRLPSAAARAALGRSVRWALALGFLVLGVTALLAQQAPPRSLAPSRGAAGPHGHHALGHAVAVPAGQRLAIIRLVPGRAGANVVTVRLSGPDGAPQTAKDVTLRLSHAAAGIEAIARTMVPAGDGVYRWAGPDFALPGRWTIEVAALVSDFERATFAAEIDLR